MQPLHLYSPNAVLRRKVGNAYEVCTILCSMLIGAGYKAYIVSGYATEEMCMGDQTRLNCTYIPKRYRLEKKKVVVLDNEEEELVNPLPELEDIKIKVETKPAEPYDPEDDMDPEEKETWRLIKQNNEVEEEVLVVEKEQDEEEEGGEEEEDDVS